MADKEERIWLEFDIPKPKGAIEATRCTTMTRQEAINRMAKAICASNMAPNCLWECETCDRWKGSDKEAAEAALNALLENKK